MAARSVPSYLLNTGHRLPALGLGSNISPVEAVTQVVQTAVRAGYRLIDTAWLYRSQTHVAAAIDDCIKTGEVTRGELFLSSKLQSTAHAPEQVEPAARETLRELNQDYLDLYIMHWPMAWQEPVDGRAWDLFNDFKPANIDYLDTWKAMERLVDKGLVRSLGVSNFNISQLKRLLSADLKYKPANLQVEIHPYFLNCEIIDFCHDNDISVSAYTPLAKGGRQYLGKPTPQLLKEECILELAKKYKKTPAQIVLRWGTQRGYTVVPKSSNLDRIVENIRLFDFELTANEMEDVSSLNKDLRLVKIIEFRGFPEYPFE